MTAIRREPPSCCSIPTTCNADTRTVARGRSWRRRWTSSRSRGKARLKHDDHERVWYSDFLDHVGRERIFASLLTPAEYGAARLPLGHLPDQRVRRDLRLLRAQLLVPVPGDRPGPGPDLDERQRGRQAQGRRPAGAGRGVRLRPVRADPRRRRLPDRHDPDAVRTAAGPPTARSTTSATPTSPGWSPRSARSRAPRKQEEYVFFAADSQHDRYDLIKNVVNSQNYVANYALRDYPVTEADLLHRGIGAPSTPRSTRSTSASTTWAGAPSACAPTPCTRRSPTPSNRYLYGTVVTDFSHVRRLLTDAYVRLVAMRLVATRAMRLHAQRVGRGPPLPAVQPAHQGQDHQRGRARHHRAVGRHRRQGRGEGHHLRDGDPRDRPAAPAGRHRPHQHRAARPSSCPTSCSPPTPRCR